VALTARRVVVINHAAVRDLLRGPEMTALLVSMGHSIAEAAGPGHEVVTDFGPNRVRVEVVTDTFEAQQNEASHHRLSSAIDNGRR
jgi:hypothetical protein